MINKSLLRPAKNDESPNNQNRVPQDFHIANYTMRSIVHGSKQLMRICQTIILNKIMIDKNKKVCPICKKRLMLDGITIDGYKVYRCYFCGKYNELVPIYINFFETEIVV